MTRAVIFGALIGLLVLIIPDTTDRLGATYVLSVLAGTAIVMCGLTLMVWAERRR